MSQFDAFDHGPPPDDLAAGEAGFGTRAVRLPDGRRGVRLMLKRFRIMAADDGDPIAFVEVQIPSAVQAVQACRQAIHDARKGRFR